MQRDLETLRDKLWEIFEEAHARHSKYGDEDPASYRPFNPKIENRNAMANLGQAIVSVEQEIRLRAAEAENGSRYLEKPKMPANKA
jgi:hypothetical protein